METHVHPRPARVVKTAAVEPHPDAAATNIELLKVIYGIEVITLVVGKHYRAGDLGIYVPPGWRVPGYLAEENWLVKKGRNWFAIEDRIIRGVQSPGIFIGSHFQNSRESAWQKWVLWRDRWVEGEDVTEYLGLVAAT